MTFGGGSSQRVQNEEVMISEQMLTMVSMSRKICARREVSLPEKRDLGFTSSIGEEIAVFSEAEAKGMASRSSADTKRIVRSGDVRV